MALLNLIGRLPMFVQTQALQLLPQFARRVAAETAGNGSFAFVSLEPSAKVNGVSISFGSHFGQSANVVARLISSGWPLLDSVAMHSTCEMKGR